MKRNVLHVFMCLFLSLIAMSVFAGKPSNPASQEYVNKKAAALQAQIDNIQPGSPLKIGDFYQGGVIFYLDNAQRKGLLVAIKDANYLLSTGCTLTPGNGPYGSCYWWDNTGTQTTGATGANYFTGQQNTQAILVLNPGPTVYPAAYVAHQYSTPQDPSGAYWYLPSQGELNELMLAVNNAPQINAAITTQGGQILPLLGSNGVYWSSTEYVPNDLSAWVVVFNSGNVYSNGKASDQFGVRPVRAFSY